VKEDTAVVVVSYSGKEINAKLVYYGAGLSGKTTNLESIYEAVPDTSRGKMVSMKTQSDRTLFFDLLPLDLGEIMGFRTRFLLYTVPGQVFYNATRKLVLKGADAIVFVADSEVGKMEENKESLENLRANLMEYKLNLDDLPWVIQYNKRDLPNLYTCEELNAELNPGGRVPHFEAVATQGKGVFETFRGISHLLMEKVTKDLRRAPASSGPARRAAPPEEPAAHGPGAASTPRIAQAPTLAPSTGLEREASSTHAVTNGAEDEMLEYGRQIDLPDQIPPPSKPVAEPRRPAVHPIPAPAGPAVSPAGSRGTSGDPSGAALRAPSLTSEVAERPEGGPATVVVPVAVPAAGKTTEIVVRIVVTSVK
jgi:hypothetical protein